MYKVAEILQGEKRVHITQLYRDIYKHVSLVSISYIDKIHEHNPRVHYLTDIYKNGLVNSWFFVFTPVLFILNKSSFN